MTESVIDRWQVPAATCRGHQLVHANPQLLRILGEQTQQSVTGRSWTELATEDQQPVLAEWLDQLSHNNGTCPVLRTQLVGSNDAIVDVAITHVCRNTADASEWTAVLDAGDTSFREFQTLAARKAAASLQMIEFGELAVSLLHDLGQPITAVQAAGEIVEADVSTMNVPEDFRRLINIISRSGQELSRQHAVIRNYVRHRRLSTQIASVEQLLSESVSLVRGFANARQIQLELVVSDSLPPIPLDSGLIQLGFISMLNQTMRLVQLSAPADRRILIRLGALQDGGQQVTVEFQYPAQDVSLSYDEFETTRRVAALHGGEMTIESPAENVARCRLLLP